jgi:hypothetical protein
MNIKIKTLIREAQHYFLQFRTNHMTYEELSTKCKPIKTKVNKLLAIETDRLNKKYNCNRKPVQVKVLADWGRFKI